MSDWLPPAGARPETRGGPSGFPRTGGGGDNGPAVAALVLGIVGLVVLLLTFGFGAVLSLPLSILAWVFGVKGRRRADRGEGGQRGLAQAGLVMGIIGVVLAALAIVVLAVLLATSDGFIEDIERQLDRQEMQTRDAATRPLWSPAA